MHTYTCNYYHNTYLLVQGLYQHNARLAHVSVLRADTLQPPLNPGLDPQGFFHEITLPKHRLDLPP